MPRLIRRQLPWPRRQEEATTQTLLAARPHVRAALNARLRTLVTTLSDAAPSEHAHADTDALLDALDPLLVDATPDIVWLALSVLNASMPDSPTVQRVTRAIALDGPRRTLERHALLPQLAHIGHLRNAGPLDVSVVTGRVIVDLDNTTLTPFMTGIQRVAYETTKRWVRDQDPVLVGWHVDRAGMRELLPEEQIPGGQIDAAGQRIVRPKSVLVPWRCTYISPELISDPRRYVFLNSLIRHSGNTSGFIGFDCVPLTTAETVQSDAVGSGFAGNLAAISRANRVATISEAAAVEYRGWKAMLSGTGVAGPEIKAISLPAEAAETTPEALASVRQNYLLGALPTVLAVGSHEPRKNHEAVLHAAEILWREGLEFSLLFFGGNAWNSERFRNRITALAVAGRPIQMLSAVSDDELWAAYRLAYCTIFPSLNEGFGLPVAESLAAGTPVITSEFGSMREIAEDGGAILVDPRDDHDIADGLRRMLTDATLHAELERQALARPSRTWDDYARELWDYLVPADALGSPAGQVGSP